MSAISNVFPKPARWLDEWSQQTKRRFPRLYALLFNSIVNPIVGALIGLVIVSRLTGVFAGPDHYTIYFAGPMGANMGVNELVAEFRKAELAPPRNLHGVPVIIQHRDDGGEPTVAQRVARQLIAQNDTLMVLGHVFSSSTKEALPIYFTHAKPAVPVILMTETSPDVLPPRERLDESFPVYRLSPTDDAEAQAALQFARSRHGKALWVVEDDVANPVYAHSLAQQLVEQDQNSGSRMHVLLQSSPLQEPDPQTITDLDIDWVFYAGTWQNALVLVREVRRQHQLRKLRIILSDSCAGDELLSHGGADLEGVYVVHPLRAKTFMKDKYGAYAQDTLELVDQLLDRANQDFANAAAEKGGLMYYVRVILGIHRIEDARNALIAGMRDLSEEQIRLTNTGEVSFDKHGSLIHPVFHMWRITNSSFAEAE